MQFVLLLDHLLISCTSLRRLVSSLVDCVYLLCKVSLEAHVCLVVVCLVVTNWAVTGPRNHKSVVVLVAFRLLICSYSLVLGIAAEQPLGLENVCLGLCRLGDTV